MKKSEEITQITQVTSGSGKTVSLPCTATTPDDGANGKYVLEWKKDGEAVYTAFSGETVGHASLGYTGRTSHDELRKLIISPVQVNDQGVYWCIIKGLNRPADNPIGVRVKLEVQTPPVFIDMPPKMIYKKPGDSLKLRCVAEGIPTPLIYWTKDGMPIVDNARVSVVDADEINIRQLGPTDEGVYRCLATNAEGNRFHDVQIIFAKGVYFDAPPNNATALAGSTFVWQCHAKAEPGEVQYEWYFGDKQTLYASRLGLRSTVENGNLSISPVEKEDAGWFVCRANGGFGQHVEAKAYLDVQYRPEILSSTSTIQYIPKGLSGQLTCNVDANPPANFIKWTKNGKALSFDSIADQRSASVSRRQANLSFKTVSAEDAGSYTCQAYNTIGDSNVYEMHALVAEPPYFMVEPNPVFHKVTDDRVTFSCQGDGEPKPRVFWRKLGAEKILAENKVLSLGDAKFTIESIKAEDHGCYECVIENIVASLNKQTCLYVDNTAPQPPENVTTELGLFDARVSWVPGYSGGEGGPQKFFFKYREKDSGTVWKEEDVFNRTYVLLNNLNPNTEYEFYVEPWNEIGKGFPTSVISAKTKGYTGFDSPTDASGVTYLNRQLGPPPLPPANLEVKAKHQTLRFEWDTSEPAYQQAQSVRHFSLEYRENAPPFVPQAKKTRNNEVELHFQKLIDEISEKHVEVNGADPPLQPGRTYDFRVRAHSLAAKSDPSNTVTFTVPGVSPQTALIAGVVGGLLFLLLCLILTGLALKFSKMSKKKKSVGSQQNGKFSLANGHQINSSVQLDDNSHGFGTGSKKSDRSGFADVSTQSRKPSLAHRIKWAAKKHLTLSNHLERTNWQYRNSQTSATLGSNESMPNVSGRASVADVDTDASNHHPPTPINADGLINYLQDRAGGNLNELVNKRCSNQMKSTSMVDDEEKRLSRNVNDAMCNSINTLLRRFHSDTWKQANNNKPSVENMKGADNEGRKEPPVAVTPLGDAGYLFRLKTQYDRDKLLGTITALRENQPPMQQPIDYSPSVETLALSFNNVDDSSEMRRKLTCKVIVDQEDDEVTVVPRYENVYSSMNNVETAEKDPRSGEEARQQVSHSSSSSGVCSQSVDIGLTQNPVNLMYREMYITNSGVVSPASFVVVDTLDNDARFQRLREEFRRSGRISKYASPRTVTESPVL